MNIVAMIINLILFLGFIVGLFWLGIGFWVGLAGIIYDHSKKKVIRKGWFVLAFGGFAWMILILVMWLIMNIIMQLFGVPTSSINDGMILPSTL